jgi:hypothetical protein
MFNIPRLTRRPPVNFWRAPLWKWAVFAAVLAASAVLLGWEQHMVSPPLIKVEFLPTQYPAPARNGSYPVFAIDVMTPTSGPPKFNAAISMRTPTIRHDAPIDHFEVDLRSGMFVLRKTDLFVSDVMPLALTRTYRPWDNHSRAFGFGTNHPYDICPTGPRSPYSSMDLNLEDGMGIHFDRISRGTGYADAVLEYHDTSDEFYGAQIWWNGNGWTLHFLDGRVDLFPEAYFAQTLAQGAATEMRDAAGNRIRLQRDRRRNLERLVSPSGHAINLTYDSQDRIVQAWDDVGDFRKYSYSRRGDLETISDWSHVLYRFEYDLQIPSRHLMTAIMDGNWKVILRNDYQAARISDQKLANGDVYRFDYVFDSNGNVLATRVTFPDARKRRFYFEKGILSRQE